MDNRMVEISFKIDEEYLKKLLHLQNKMADPGIWIKPPIESIARFSMYYGIEKLENRYGIIGNNKNVK